MSEHRLTTLESRTSRTAEIIAPKIAHAAVELGPIPGWGVGRSDHSVIRTEADALRWLAERDNGRVETTIAGLAREWRWARTTLRRGLKEWEDAGLIVRTAGSGGRSIISLGPAAGQNAQTAATGQYPALSANGHTGPATVTRQNGPAATDRDAMTAPPGQISPLLATATEAQASTPLPPPIGSAATLAGQPGSAESATLIDAAMPLGLVLAALAIALAWQGIRINAWYGTTLGNTAEARGLLSNLSMAADAVAFTLPAAARAFWCRRWRLITFAAWVVWCATITVAVMATVGFLSTNIADSGADRVKMAGQNTSLAARIERLRAEQAAVTEFRPATTIEAEIQGAPPRVDPAVWKSTDHCRNVTIKTSGEACAELLRLKQAMGLAQRRDTVESELREAESDFARLPAVTTADPQIVTAVALVTWLSGSRIAISQHDVAMTRLVAIALLPQLAGVVLMFAMALLSGAFPAILARLVAPLKKLLVGDPNTKDFRAEGSCERPATGQFAAAVSPKSPPPTAGRACR